MTIIAALMRGVEQLLADAVSNGAGTNGSAYALLPRASLVTWQTFYGSAPASVTMQIQTSNDNVAWNTTASSTAVGGEIGTFQTSARFIRARMNAVSGGTTFSVSVVVKPVG